MSEPENFLARWSRRKQEAGREVEDQRAGTGDDSAPEPVRETAAGEGKPQEQPEVDLSRLPPIESIDAETDIRAFFQKGVPPDLTRAALRRAWSSDPAIRDFIGIAENQWDFATGSDIPGFGPLEAFDDVLRKIAAVTGEDPAVVTAKLQAEPKPPAEHTTQALREPPDFETVAQQTPPSDDPEAEQASSSRAQTLPAASSADISHCTNEASATQSSSDQSNGTPLPTKRGHGRALPR